MLSDQLSKVEIGLVGEKEKNSRYQEFIVDIVNLTIVSIRSSSVVMGAASAATLSRSAAFSAYPRSTSICRVGGLSSNVFARHRKASLEMCRDPLSKAWRASVSIPFVFPKSVVTDLAKRCRPYLSCKYRVGIVRVSAVNFEFFESCLSFCESLGLVPASALCVATNGEEANWSPSDPGAICPLAP